jgi:hypothetical protein
MRFQTPTIGGSKPPARSTCQRPSSPDGVPSESRACLSGGSLVNESIPIPSSLSLQFHAFRIPPRGRTQTSAARSRARLWEMAKVHVTGRGRQRPSSCCRRIVRGTFTCSVDHTQYPQDGSALRRALRPLRRSRASGARFSEEELADSLCVGRSGRCSVRPGASWSGGWQSDA